ncbi:MAG: DNA-binding protein [Bdellovibrio sp.]|nr:MAG: DNA-binding protein [Bdellovibrio sp.]
MQNKGLALDYITRAKKRLAALRALHRESAWADVVRESQEVVELALKSLLRFYHVEIPRIHDVSGVLENEKSKFPVQIKRNLERYQQISRTLRRDRELAFYGSEDLTPMEFYKKEDADVAMESAEWVVHSLLPLFRN